MTETKTHYQPRRVYFGMTQPPSNIFPFDSTYIHYVRTVCTTWDNAPDIRLRKITEVTAALSVGAFIYAYGG